MWSPLPFALSTHTPTPTPRALTWAERIYQEEINLVIELIKIAFWYFVFRDAAMYGAPWLADVVSKCIRRQIPTPDAFVEAAEDAAEDLVEEIKEQAEHVKDVMEDVVEDVVESKTLEGFKAWARGRSASGVENPTS